MKDFLSIYQNINPPFKIGEPVSRVFKTELTSEVSSLSIITTHINADFDALASIVAARKLYPEALVVLPGSMEKRVRQFIEIFNPLPDIKKPREIDKERIKKIIIVDTSSAERLGILKELISGGEKIRARIVIYDHHRNGDLLTEVSKTDIEVNIDDVGATSTLFTEILQKRNIQLTPLEATLLCLGIYEETGSLTFPSTTDRDLIAAAYLLRRGANLNIVSNFLKPFISREELTILTDLLNESKEIIIGKLRFKICKTRIEEYPGEIAHLAHRIMEIENIDGLILLIDIAGKITLIARSNVPELDVSELLSPFGGGGHPYAASASIKDKSLEELELEIAERLKDIVRPQRLAKDIMTTHVIAIEPEANIKEAERELTKYGVNVLPVVKNGKLLGLISRETVEKALFHGFRLHRVMEFAEIDPEVVSPDTPLRDVERLMIEKNQRFMPVVKDGKLVGAITRTDILRTMYEGLMDKEISEPGVPRVRNLSGRLKEQFPEKTMEMLRAAGDVADILGYNAYLVGGSVRDLMMGQRNLDIDIVVEGDGIIFAEKLAELLEKREGVRGIRVRTHERFGTAKIIIPEESQIEPSHIDIATARTEYYESPAALPKIETSSIKKDLYRRDFTINTLAIKLNSRDFGNLIDFFGGQKDLKEKTIRVLHSMSLVEDPTRALRAIRFSERFGFRISKHTENLIKQAANLNLFERLSSQRLYEELSLLFREVSPYRAMERLSEYDLLKVIAPSLKWNEEMKKRFRNLEELLAWHSLSNIKEEVSRDKVSIEAAIYELPGQSLERSLERIGPNRRYISVVQRDIQGAKATIRRLQTLNVSEIDSVRVYELFKDLTIESIFLMASVLDDREVKKLCIRYLTELKDIKPAITGKDLLKLGIQPGPKYSRIFREILYEKLRGRLKTLEEEIDFVKRMVGL
ncbi:MAG: CBS domain-containing protein [Thermodesulfovibrionales bacterium]|nr:CBS domain-containing protein [Thermodesulfovibrionales bacterium]